jgi:hypothetical protein
MDVFLYKTDAMRELLKLVSRGYFRWTSGVVESKKAEALTLKFIDRYEIDKSHQQRWRHKARGLANAHLIMLADAASDQVRWWLVVTAGEGLVEMMETLKDANGKHERLTLWDDDYELVRLQRKDGQTQWTWRMTAGNVEAWEERIKNAVANRHSQKLIEQAFWSLKRIPGFHGTRRQAFELARFAEARWKRVRGKSEPYPFKGFFVGWQGKYSKGEKIPVRSISKAAIRKKIHHRQTLQKLGNPNVFVANDDQW